MKFAIFPFFHLTPNTLIETCPPYEIVMSAIGTEKFNQSIIIHILLTNIHNTDYKI